MKTSQEIGKIAPALLKAQISVGTAKKDATNSFFKSSYSTLGSVMEACKEQLNENGITVLQPLVIIEGKNVVQTMLLHESGEYMVSEMLISAKSDNDPQAQGSAISYARRYALQSIMFIPAEDDDAEKSMQRPVSIHEGAQRTVTPLPPRTASTPSDYGNCEHCGSVKVMSQTTKKVYCSAKCWLK